MKYKNVDSAIHNIGHSFMSGMNYVDDDHVFHEMRAAVRKEPHEVWINFSTGEIGPARMYPPRLCKSVALYQAGLSDHLARHNVDPGAVCNVRLHHRLTRSGGTTTMHATDDRGKEHVVVVTDTP